MPTVPVLSDEDERKRKEAPPVPVEEARAENEYDLLLKERPGALGNAPPAADAHAEGADGNEYDRILAERTGAAKLALNTSLYLAGGVNPDEEAGLISLSKKTGIPVEALRSPKVKSEAIAQETSAALDYDRMVTRSPKTAEFLSKQENARIAHDDVETLASIEGVIDMMGRGAPTIGTPDVVGAFRSGQRQQWQGRIGWRLKEGETTPGLREEATALGEEISAQNELMQEKSGTLSGDFLEPAAQVLGQMFEGGKYAVSKGLKLGLTMGAVGTAMGPTAPVTGPAAAIAGLGAGATAGFFEDSMRVEGGQAYLELTGIRGAKGEALPEESVRTAATIVGVVNGALELAGLQVLAAPWKRLVRKGIQEAATEEAKKLLVRQTTGRAVTTFAREYAAGVSAETVQEIAQEVTNVIAEETLKSQQGGEKFDATTWEEVGRRLYDIGSQTARAMAVIGIVGPGANLRSDIRSARAARNAQDTFKALGEASATSKLRERLPEKFREFVDQVTADGPVANVFIPVDEWNTYFQSQGADPGAVAQQVLGDRAQYQEAVAAGGDLVIPMGRYAEVLAGTEHHAGLVKDLRLHPGEMTAREADLFRQNFPGRTAELDALEEPGASDLKVYEDVLAQLTSAGRAPEVAAREATLWQVRYRTRAQRLGVDPHELYRERSVKITGPAQSAFVLDDLSAPSEEVRQSSLWKGLAQEMVEKKYRGKKFEAGVPLLERLGKGGRMLASTAELRGIQASENGLTPFFTTKRTLKKGETLKWDVMLQSLVEEGYLREGASTLDDLVDAIQADQEAKKTRGVRLTPGGVTDYEIAREAAKWGHFQDKRGFIRIGPKGEVEIGLLEKANLSTFLHETGHAWLEELRADVARENASGQLKADWNLIAEHLGLGDLAQGVAIPAKAHETFARLSEAYLMEGISPSPELASAFQRFKAWLVQVYREISRLGVTLSPDVRGVFDRLVATDEEIAAAASSQRRAQLFTSAESAGMTDAEFAVHRKNVERAHVAAKDRLERKLIAEYSRTRTALWKEEREKVRAEVEEESNQTPVFQVYHLLTRGELLDGSQPAQPIKLSRKAFIDAYGQEFVDRLPPKWFRKMTAEDGVHPDLVAEMFGFSSGDAMIKRLLEAPHRATWIEEETDRRMREAHGDPLNDGSIAEAAMDAVHNDEEGVVLREEERALRRKALQVRPFVDQALRASESQKRDLRREMEASIPPDQALREIARNTISRKSISGIRPYLYAQAEAKADRKAFDAAAKGDFDTAAAEKRKQRLNHHLYIEASKASEEVSSALELFEKPFRSDVILAKSRDADLVNAARAVLAQYGFGEADRSPMTYLEQIRKMNPDLYGDLTAAVDAATQDPKPYKELSLTEFRALRDAVANLWHLSHRTRVIEIEGQKIDRGEVLADLVARMDEVGMPERRPGYDRAMTNWEKTKMKLLGARAALRRVESWVSAIDGEDSGPFRKYVWNPVSEGADAWREARKVYLQKFLDRVRGVEKTLTLGKIDAREIGYEFKDKAELLHAIAHVGNGSNKSKLLRGRGWGVIKDGSLDTSRWDAFVRRMWDEGRLTKEDYDFAQAVWDLLEELKPQAQQAHREMYGYYFSEITAEPVVTPWGTYRGGYVPAIVDPYVSLDAAVRQQREEIEGSNNSFMFPTTGRGFTKGRINEYAKPLLLDLRYLPAHIDKVLRFVHIEPHVKDVGRLIFNHAFRAQLDTFDPGVAGDMLVPWLQRAARQVVELPGRSKLADDFFRGVRRRTGLQIMVANVANALQQFTGLSIAALKVEPKYLGNALWRYVHGPSEMAEDISEKSSFMRNRVTGQVFEIQKTIDDMLLNPSKYEEAREFAVKHGYFLQAGTQNIVDLITWAGAYEKAVEDKVPEPDAVRRADSAVRETQGSFAAEDVSAFETGSPFFRAFTQFYGYFNMQANLLGTEFVKTVRSLGWRGGASRLFGIYFFGFMIPSFVSELIVRAMSGRLDADDDGEYLDDILAAFFGSQFRTAAAMIPGVGPAVVAGVNAFNDRWYDDRISTSPMVSVLESSVRAPHSVYKAIAEDGSQKRAIKDVLTAVGMATGLPVAPLGRPLGYLADVEEGRANPEDAVDFTRGLISGR